MSGKCRPSLRGKTLHNVMRSSLSNTDKECVKAVFERFDNMVEVKHGRWIKPAGMLKIFENKYVICSECNVMLPIITELNRYYYCPKCGAEMDGKAWEDAETDKTE